MTTCFAYSRDGSRIAYDASGAGTPVVLLHGGGHTRQHWHGAGYVERLTRDARVIAIDIRGNGESEKPTDPASYTTDKHCQDILAVADTCGVERFALWGFSYGANIGRYLAAQSTRVARFVMVGIPFGPGAPDNFRQLILSFRDHWSPIVQAQADGALNARSLSAEDRDTLQRGGVPVTLAWLTAMLNWPSVEPGDITCPTLWLAGSKNDAALASMHDYESTLKTSRVQVEVVEGLNHEQEFTAIDTVFESVHAFIRS
jgi:pimeloyl-ACP methyl ester carboxylesterase